MGQKVNPIGFRLKISKKWLSSWICEAPEYAACIMEDLEIRKYIRSELSHAGIADIFIMRKAEQINVQINAARPGIIVGKAGVDMVYHREDLSRKIGKNIIINVVQEKNPNASARLLAEMLSGQLEKRVAFRRAMKITVQWALKAGVTGVKVRASGRLGGVEIARCEWYREGNVPLHTLRANVDYAFTEACTTYGKIGVKVWTYKGDVDSLYGKDEDSDDLGSSSNERALHV
ncbi:MAG: 30S ribosomal protein S3 [Candidatus Margulisbacteria bacterium]|nr:30S ribosomal protein S3 [Candidatus Margulisiibacteriota bacterium]